MLCSRRNLLVLAACLGAGAASVALSGCFAPFNGESKRELRIAAAADLRFALHEIVAEFQREQPNIEVKVTYGSSGNFYAQLSNRAPFDLFLSADNEYPHKLVERGLATEGATFDYAVGILVLWAPKDSGLDLQKAGLKALLESRVRKIAMANPKHAPYGRAAEAALKKLQIYDQVADKLVFGENVMLTAQYVESAAADVGLIPLSLATAPALRDRGQYWQVPLDAYPPLVQGGVLLPWAKDAEGAHAFRDFLTAAAGKAVLRRYGFIIPGE